MKKFYNNIIKWTFYVIAALASLPLFVLKLAMLFTIKVAKAILFVVNELFISTMKITKGLAERLSVKD